jgi:N-acetylglucosaminyl-diphospho-decaprenol L-rhamnosyltransferase
MVDAQAGTLTLSVVSHGHGVLLWRLLDDLQRHASLRGTRVIVTLNVPEDFDSARWPGLNLLVLRNEHPRGFGANHNAAFLQATGRWFGVLNPDLRVPVDPFPALLAAAGAKARPGVVAPHIVDTEGLDEDSVRANLTPWSLLLRRFDPGAGQVSVSADGGAPGFFWLAGMFLLFSVDAYRRIGGFDERFFLYCEDYDICARLHLDGADIAIVPAATAIHAAQRDSHRTSRHLRWHLVSLARVWTSAVFWRVTLGGPLNA